MLQQGSEKALKKQSMKTLLECLEDIQADLEEAQNTNDAIVDDFREEIQVRHKKALHVKLISLYS